MCVHNGNRAAAGLAVEGILFQRLLKVWLMLATSTICPTWTKCKNFSSRGLKREVTEKLLELLVAHLRVILATLRIL